MTFPHGQMVPPPRSPGIAQGVKFVKSGLKRAALKKREAFDRACERAFDDARETDDPKTRVAVLSFIRDTIDGRPEQAEGDGDHAPRQVIIVNAAAGADIAFPLEIDRALRLELEQGPTEPVDLDDQLPTNGHDAEDEELE